MVEQLGPVKMWSGSGFGSGLKSWHSNFDLPCCI